MKRCTEPTRYCGEKNGLCCSDCIDRQCDKRCGGCGLFCFLSEQGWQPAAIDEEVKGGLIDEGIDD